MRMRRPDRRILAKTGSMCPPAARFKTMSFAPSIPLVAGKGVAP